MGAVYLENLKSEKVAALCDVDRDYAAPTFRKYPGAKVYGDFREMLEREKGIDAVVIGTPDHNHAWIATAAMRAGKGVYCAKPMARTIEEARAMARVARETGAATQMSVQTCGSERACRTAEWVRSGALGKVREVHVWTDRPIWPQALARPEDHPATPATLDWDRWLGPAPDRPYHPAYAPFVWRGWWDFGSGALGDMGCHVLHVIVRALELGAPEWVEASAGVLVREGLKHARDGKVLFPGKAAFPETAPAASIVSWRFAARGALPAVRVTWYDGGLQPPRPEPFGGELELGTSGLLFVGETGVMLTRFMGGEDVILPKRAMEPPAATMTRSAGHYQEFAEACKGGKPALCAFEFGAMLTELVLLGNIAVRTGGRLQWDAAAGRFGNSEKANQLLSEPYRKGWTL